MTLELAQSFVTAVLTKDDVIPFKYRVVGPKKIKWIFDLPQSYLSLLPFAKTSDGATLPNRYDILECIKVLIKSRAQQRANSSVAQLELARMRKLSVEVEREVIKNEMLKGTIVRLEDADAEVIDMILALRSKLLGYPSHVGRMVLGKETFEEVVRILTQEMEQALIDLKSLDFDAVRARNRKLASYTESMDDASTEVAEDVKSDIEIKDPVGQS